MFEAVWHGNKKILAHVLAHGVELRIAGSVSYLSAVPFCFDPRMVFLKQLLSLKEMLLADKYCAGFKKSLNWLF